SSPETAKNSSRSLAKNQKQILRFAQDSLRSARDDSVGRSMHFLQSFVQKFRWKILSLVPRDRCEPVIQMEPRESIAVAQRFQFLSVQLVSQIHHAFTSVVEFQPNLVVSEIARLNDMSGCVLVTGQT